MLYRRIPEIIEAVQIIIPKPYDVPFSDYPSWLMVAIRDNVLFQGEDEYWEIEYSSNIGTTSDWIIQYQSGYLDIYSNANFKELFEKVE